MELSDYLRIARRRWILILGCVVVLVQTLVFTLLTCIYIGLATEHEAH